MLKCNHRTSLGFHEEATEELAPLEEDIGIMDDDNEDVAHEGLERETDDVVMEIDADSAHEMGTLTSCHHKEALFVLKKVVGFASALCKSDQKTMALLECCEHKKIDRRKPIKVVATHWNSHIAALDRHWENHAAITRLCSAAIYEHLKVEKYALCQQEWGILEQQLPLLHVRNNNLHATGPILIQIDVTGFPGYDEESFNGKCPTATSSGSDY